MMPVNCFSSELSTGIKAGHLPGELRGGSADIEAAQGVADQDIRAGKMPRQERGVQILDEVTSGSSLGRSATSPPMGGASWFRSFLISPIGISGRGRRAQRSPGWLVYAVPDRRRHARRRLGAGMVVARARRFARALLPVGHGSGPGGDHAGADFHGGAADGSWWRESPLWWRGPSSRSRSTTPA